MARDKNFEKIFDWFNAESIKLPIAVKNAIEDVFDENDDVDEEIYLYMPEDISSFEEDLTLTNRVNVYVNKPSDGQVVEVFTYYGDVDYVLNEIVTLRNEDGSEISNITNLVYHDQSSTINPDKWAVVLVRTYTWKDGEINSILRLHLYCVGSSLEEVV